MAGQRITIAGSFIADLAFRTPRLPAWGETMLGSGFCLGPGGKGSNQAVAAARLGAKVSFIARLGHDAFGALARQTYAEEGIDTRFVSGSSEHGTGAAAIIVDEVKGENAIIVVPGSGFQLTSDDIERAAAAIEDSAVFMTQLEVPIAAGANGLKLAKRLGVMTILNPAPARTLPDSVYPLCDYLTPNETEASILAGLPAAGIDGAERAADELLRRGARNVVVTLGTDGALVKNARLTVHVPAFNIGPVVETTGAGDAFNGGFAVALAEAQDIVEAARFGCAVAGISVTRHGTAPSMPRRSEVEAVIRSASADGGVAGR